MVRGTILEELERNKGAFISGSDLAARLGVSRTAVWKAVEHLRREGYDILSEKQRGYCLQTHSDILSQFKISEGHPSAAHFRLDVRKKVDSTNTAALAAYVAGQRDLLCVASEEQTHGRGAVGTRFSSPGHKGVYMSILAFPQTMEAGRMDRFSKEVFDAVCRVITETAGLPCIYQSPASLVMEGEKIGGILLEAVSEYPIGKVEAVIVGVGINVYEKERPSLYRFTGRYCNRSTIIGDLLEKIYPLLH